jgi:hypothetical protein
VECRPAGKESQKRGQHGGSSSGTDKGNMVWYHGARLLQLDTYLDDILVCRAKVVFLRHTKLCVAVARVHPKSLQSKQ